MNPWNLITMVTLLFVSKSADHLRKKKEGNLKNIEVNCTLYASLLFFLAVLSSTCCQSPFWRTEQIQVLLIAWTLIMWKLQEELPFSHLSGRTELSPVWMAAWTEPCQHAKVDSLLRRHLPGWSHINNAGLELKWSIHSIPWPPALTFPVLKPCDRFKYQHQDQDFCFSSYLSNLSLVHSCTWKNGHRAKPFPYQINSSTKPITTWNN